MSSDPQFPHGKLNDSDEGALEIKIFEEQGTVRIDFGKQLDWFALYPDQAIDFAQLIIQQALAVKRRPKH